MQVYLLMLYIFKNKLIDFMCYFWGMELHLRCGLGWVFTLSFLIGTYVKYNRLP